MKIYQCTIFKYFHLYQFNSNFDGDYISIQEIDSNGNQTLVAHLTGPDEGPKSESAFSNWNRKIISTSTNRMNVEFIADDENTTGFFPGLELDGDAVSKLDVFIEAVDAEISTSFPKDVDEIV